MWSTALLHAGKVIYTLTYDKTATTPEHRYLHMVCESWTPNRMYAELLATPQAIAARLKRAQRYDLHECDRTACPKAATQPNGQAQAAHDFQDWKDRERAEGRAVGNVASLPENRRNPFTCDADGDCDDDIETHEHVCLTTSLPG